MGRNCVRTHDFAEIAPELMARVNQMVWCSAATIDGQGRPRSRILHPLWEGSVAWVTTDPRSLKSRHLARYPYVSLAYVGDIAKPAYADCFAEWVTDRETRQRVWDLCLQTPPPMGFDPAPIYGAVDGPLEGRPAFGVLKLTPYRVVLTQWPEPATIWTPAESPVGSGETLNR
jgi:hypothetical protein